MTCKFRLNIHPLMTCKCRLIIHPIQPLFILQDLFEGQMRVQLMGSYNELSDYEFIQTFYQTIFYRKLEKQMSEAIKVVVRVRPMNSKQKERECTSIVKVSEEANQISLIKPDEVDNIKSFAFDHVFPENSQQEVVYSKTAYNLVENVLLGYNGTIFAYGQTGCGKTHSMIGKVEVQQLQGIIPRSFGHILKTISETKDKEFLIRCSFIEIYNEEVRDLLGKDVKAKLQVKESPDKGVFIKDLSMNQAKSHEQLMGYMNEGNKNRAVGETAMNKDSSRSHLLFMLFLQSADLSQAEDKKYVASKLNLVDLAGSERLSKTGAAGDRLKQAQKINLSLSALGNVISALVDGKSQHIPYRDSKLTRLLQDSLGGNTKTVMIANCSPADYNFDETLSTLRYASRAKFIKNKPIINEDPKDALLKQYAQEIKLLKLRLQSEGKELSLNGPLAEQSQEMNAKLMEKEQQLHNQKQQKEKLLQKIRDLEAKHLQGKDVHIDPKVKAKVERARISLEDNICFEKMSHLKEKSQEQEERKLLNEIEKVATNKGNIEQYKALLKRHQNKVRELELELKDINQENYLEKEILLDDVRSITRENKLLEGIISILLLPSELQSVKLAAEFNEEKGQYRIPPFYLRNKSLNFPKLPDNQALEMIRQTQENRKLCWGKDVKQNPSKQNKDSILKNNVSLANLHHGENGGLANKSQHNITTLIREARSYEQNTSFQQGNKQEKRNPRKLQLDPIRKQNRPEF